MHELQVTGIQKAHCVSPEIGLVAMELVGKYDGEST